jgi:hypothetical protein
MHTRVHSIVYLAVLLMFVRATIAQDCCAGFSPDPIPTLYPNQTVPVSITLTNNGEQTWAGYGSVDIVLSYEVLNPQLSAIEYGPATLIPTPVVKGNSIRLTVPVKAPKNQGDYSLRWFVSVFDVHVGAYNQENAPTGEPMHVIPSMFNLKTLLSVLAGYQHSHQDPRSQVPVFDPFISAVGLGPNNELPYKVGLVGDHFGDTALGQLNLKFPDKVVSALVYVWREKELYGAFRADGEPDQPAAIQVIRSDGAVSNEWPVMFIATKDFRLLPSNLIVSQCASNTYTFDQCEIDPNSPDHNWTAFHQSNCCVTGDSGTDEYSLPTLHNGWVYDTIFVDELGMEKNTSFLGVIAQTGASQTIQVNWSISLHHEVLYALRVFIRGPRGVPFN